MRALTTACKVTHGLCTCGRPFWGQAVLVHHENGRARKSRPCRSVYQAQWRIFKREPLIGEIKVWIVGQVSGFPQWEHSIFARKISEAFGIADVAWRCRACRSPVATVIRGENSPRVGQPPAAAARARRQPPAYHAANTAARRCSGRCGPNKVAR